MSAEVRHTGLESRSRPCGGGVEEHEERLVCQEVRDASAVVLGFELLRQLERGLKFFKRPILCGYQILAG
jgi:hypothetical protein